MTMLASAGEVVRLRLRTQSASRFTERLIGYPLAPCGALFPNAIAQLCLGQLFPNASWDEAIRYLTYQGKARSGDFI